jgi:hypothetical protein
MWRRTAKFGLLGLCDYTDSLEWPNALYLAWSPFMALFLIIIGTAVEGR